MDRVNERLTRKAHFIDRLFGDVLASDHKRHNDVKEKADIDENESELLSISKIANNFNSISSKLNFVKVMISEVNDIVNWKENDKTLTYLLLYTWGCINPYFFLIYPILFIIRKICLNYLKKYPIYNKPSKPVKNLKLIEYWDIGLGPRLNSTKNHENNGIFGFLWDTKVSEEENRVLEMREEFKIEDDQDTSKNETTENKNSYNNVIMRNLYEIQMQSSEILRFIEKIELFLENNCDFCNNERNVTILVYKLSLIVIIGCCLGNYIPWSILFILLLWIPLLLNHPMKGTIFEILIDNSRDKSEGNKIVNKEFDASNVIIDEVVFTRKVEIFELQRIDMLTRKEYVFIGFTNCMYNLSDKEFRNKRKLPICTTTIEETKPPSRFIGVDNFSEEWTFLPSDEWNAVSNAMSWFCEYNNFNDLYMKFPEDEWVYDITDEFRRRKWTRSVVLKN